MAQWVKALVTKSDDLSSIPEIHTKERANFQMLPSIHALHHTHASINAHLAQKLTNTIKIVKKEYTARSSVRRACQSHPSHAILPNSYLKCAIVHLKLQDCLTQVP